jgi:hypothetical protein
MLKDKTEEKFQEAYSRFINFCNSNGHRVDVMRIDDVTVFMVEYGITPEPAAVGEQNQNPVEHEVQTLKRKSAHA